MEQVTAEVAPNVIPLAATAVSTVAKVGALASFANEMRFIDAAVKVPKNIPMGPMMRYGHYATFGEMGTVIKQAARRFNMMSLSEAGSMTWNTTRAIERGLAQLPEGNATLTGGKFRVGGGKNLQSAFGETLGKLAEMKERFQNFKGNLGLSSPTVKPKIKYEYVKNSDGSYKLNSKGKYAKRAVGLEGDIDIIHDNPGLQGSSDAYQIVRKQFGELFNRAAGTDFVDIWYKDHGILPTKLPNDLVRTKGLGWNPESMATKDLYKYGGELNKQKKPGVFHNLKSRFVIETVVGK